MKSFAKMMLLGLIAACSVNACGDGDKQPPEEQNPNSKPDKPNQPSTDTTTDTDQDLSDKNWTCSGKHQGFEVKYVEGTVIQNSQDKNGWLQFSGIDVDLAYDSYYKDLRPSSYPYNYILIEIYAENGQNYPITPGTYKLGTTPSERNVHTCLNCVTLGMDVSKKGNPAKKLFATEGTVVIKAMDEGNIKATLSNAFFQEYTEEFDDEGEPLSADFVAGGETWCVQNAQFDGTSFFVYQGN